MYGRSKIETKEGRCQGQILRLLRRKALGERIGYFRPEEEVLFKAMSTDRFASKNQREIRYTLKSF